MAGVAQQPPPLPSTAQATRHAIIFIPGLGGNWVNQSITTIGAKLASALDNQAATRSATFSTKTWEESYGPNGIFTAAACSISRRDASGDAGVIDVYRLDALRDLRERWDRRSLLVKTLLPAFLLLLFVGRALRRAKTPAKSRRQRFQFFYAVLVGAAISAYIALVVYSIVALIVPAKALNGLSEQIPQGIALALTIIGLGKADVVKVITDTAVDNLSAMTYLRYGDRREQLVGSLARLVQHLSEREQVRYDRFDVIAYSFGSLVALDSLFPPRGRGVATFADVRGLVTIGCPFDFVRTYWPHYFDDRDLPASGGVPALRWLNIYLPIDVLSSNFREDDKREDAAVGIPTNNTDSPKPENLVYDDPATNDQLGLADFVALLGLRSHDFYWDCESSADLGVFPQIVARQYANDPVLA